MEKLGENYLYGEVAALPQTGEEELGLTSETQLDLYIAERLLSRDLYLGRGVIAGGMARAVLSKDKTTNRDIDVFYFSRRHFLKQVWRFNAAMEDSAANRAQLARVDVPERGGMLLWVDKRRGSITHANYAGEGGRKRGNRYQHLFSLYPRTYLLGLSREPGGPGATPRKYTTKLNLIYCGGRLHWNKFKNAMALLDGFDINVTRCAFVPGREKWYLVAHSAAVWDGLTRVASFNEEPRSGLPVRWFSRKRYFPPANVNIRASKYVYAYDYTIEPESFKKHVEYIRRQFHDGELVAPDGEEIDPMLDEAVREFTGDGLVEHQNPFDL